ncbi:hypothetical protein CR513_04053, partial [Mucuna pruriens]
MVDKASARFSSWQACNLLMVGKVLNLSKAVRQAIPSAGYYWPTLKQDCMEYVKRCDKCQRFVEGHKAPPERLHSITSPWPFFKWGVDILGSFPPVPGQLFTSIEHPQSNNQAKAANKVILRGPRRRLEEAKGQWAEELPHILWSYHTTPHSTTNETPFHFTFGTKAMVPVEIGEPSPRMALFEPGRNEELRANLDLLQEA